MIVTLNQINSKFNELVSNRSKISKREIKELIYLDKNTEELGMPPSSRSIDLKSGQTTRTKKRRRRNDNRHY
jgi:hypothetical protein